MCLLKKKQLSLSPVGEGVLPGSTRQLIDESKPNEPRRGQPIKIDIGKPFDKSITIDINHVNVIDCIDQSIKIDTHNSSGITVTDVIDFIDECRSYMSLISDIDFTKWC